jgi:hypothetical protein
VQAVEDSGRQEPGDGESPSLDQDAPESPPRQHGDDVVGVEAVTAHVHAQNGHLSRTRAGDGSLLSDDVERLGLAIPEDAERRIESGARVEHYPHGVVAPHPTNGELGVVVGDGAGPDDHRIGQGTEPVQPLDVRRAVDVVGVARHGGDSAIQALSELADDPPLPALEGVQKRVEVSFHR